ncbi:conserved hypothetical protein [Methanocella paludicola SANAE]|uniref:DUF4386 domain-containing protein n=1 Tax=Methanocella paludicola (strain DSM 17711 / JCM 13418 / NBRC 101707 / SANAE) TaxID=304371 RepID=D1YVM4_METPS|nr:DUF4386 domain-containing protein [Methanocella paludicola]BAI60496.1 conserved hypothetical protein [Methanocella paludicola SANAE]
MSFDTGHINGFIRRKTGDFETIVISNPNKNLARAAGILYLVMIVCGMAAQLIRGSLIVPGNGVVTTGNIVASESLFRVAFISDLFMATGFLLFAWALYVLLKPVNKNIALLFVLLATASVAILCLNLLNQFAILILVNDAGYLAAFGAVHLNALVMLFADLHYYGYYIAQISFGLWLAPLGYLVIKSGFLPRILGILLIIATFGHLFGFLAAFLLPGYESFGDLPAFLEIPFGLWLLVKGVQGQQPVKNPNQQAAIS